MLHFHTDMTERQMSGAEDPRGTMVLSSCVSWQFRGGHFVVEGSMGLGLGWPV